MSMHQPVDTRKLDEMARQIVKKAIEYTVCEKSVGLLSTMPRDDLFQLVGQYQKELLEMVLGEPEGL